jgi:arginase
LWQGEGGLNAMGLVHGAGVVSDLLAELLSATNVLRRTVPPTATPVPKPWRVPKRPARPGVLYHEDLAQQCAATLEVLDSVQPSKVFTAGGDASVDLAPCSWLQERYRGDMAVLHVAGHADLNDASESPSGHFHGMSLRALLGDGPGGGLSPRRVVAPGSVIHAGVRELDAGERRAAERFQLKSLPPDALKGAGRAASLRRELRATGCSKMHIHLDLGVLDATVYRHTSMYSRGCSARRGLEVHELQTILREAADVLPLVGLTVCELRPRFCCENKQDPRAPCCSMYRLWKEEDESQCVDVLRAVLGPCGLDVAAQTLPTRG